MKYKLIDLSNIPSNWNIKEFTEYINLMELNKEVDIPFPIWLKLKLITIINKIKKLCTEVK